MPDFGAEFFAVSFHRSLARPLLDILMLFGYRTEIRQFPFVVAKGRGSEGVREGGRPARVIHRYYLPFVPRALRSLYLSLLLPFEWGKRWATITLIVLRIHCLAVRFGGWFA